MWFDSKINCPCRNNVPLFNIMILNRKTIYLIPNFKLWSIKCINIMIDKSSWIHYQFDKNLFLPPILSLMEWQLLSSRWILKIIVVERRQPRDNNYLEIERDTREEWKLGEKIKRHRRCRVIFFTQFSWLSSVEFNFVQNSSSRE